VLEFGNADGSNEANGYAAPDYKPINPPLIVALPDIKMVDPNRWQPLQVEYQVSQNGIPVPSAVQVAIGPHWATSKSFGIPDGGAGGVPFDPGGPPRLGDAVTDALFKTQAVEVIRDSSTLDPANDTLLDISPSVIGGNPLGSNAGRGYTVNPATGSAYAPDRVRAATSIARSLSSGPTARSPRRRPATGTSLRTRSRTPFHPTCVSAAKARSSIASSGCEGVPRAHGAVHDAAIAAWGLKGRYDGNRPISIIRYMASLGQSSDPSIAPYNKAGLPLVPGSSRSSTRAKTADGGPMESLRGHEGTIALRVWQLDAPGTNCRTWDGFPRTLWVPYQLPTFVTPSFQGYISGAQARSAAPRPRSDGITGSEYFPGGLSSWTVKAGSFRTTAGPSADRRSSVGDLLRRGPIRPGSRDCTAGSTYRPDDFTDA